MSSWFGYGSPSKEDQEEVGQQAPLVANDDMQNRAHQSSRSAGRNPTEGSIIDRVTFGVQDTYISYTGKSKPEASVSPMETQNTVSAAQKNAEQAEASAQQMAEAMNWWKSSAATDAAEDAELNKDNISEDPDLLGLAEVQQLGASTVSFDIFSSLQGKDSRSKASEVENQSPGPNVKPEVQLPKSNQRKLDNVKAIIQWWERTDSGRSPESSELDQLSKAFDMLEPLMDWWGKKGKEFAVKNGHLIADEADDCDRKLKAAYKWFDKNLKKGKTLNGAELEAPSWLRGRDPETEGNGPSRFARASNLLRTPFGRGGLTAEEQRAKEMEEALGWLRSNDLKYDDPDIDDASANTIDKINSMVPGATDKDPMEVAATMEAALLWLRIRDDASNGFNLDDDSVGSFKKITGLGLATQEEARASEMENALKSLRSNDTSTGLVDNPSVLSLKFSGSKLDAIPETRGATEMDNAPDWLRKTDATYDSNLDDPSAINRSKMPSTSLLPLSPEEARANDMVNALNWLRSYETGADVAMDETSVPSFEAGPNQHTEDWFQTSGSKPIGFCDSSDASGIGSRGDRLPEMTDALDRLRSNIAGHGGKEVSFGNVPWTEFPRGRGQMGSALDWLHSNNLDLDDVDDPKVAAVRNWAGMPPRSSNLDLDGVDDPKVTAVSNGTGMPPPKGELPADARTIALQHALNRLRSHNLDACNIDDETINSLANLAGIDLPGGDLSTKDKSKSIDDALNWLYANKPSFDDFDDHTAEAFAYLSGIHMPREKLTEEKKAQTMEDALNWMRNNELNPNDVGFEMLFTLTQLAGIPMPQPKLSGEDKISVMENALDWLRSNSVDVDDVDDFTLAAIMTIPGVPIPQAQLSSEEKGNAMDEGLEWLRQHHPELKWLRQSHPDPDDFDDPTLAALAKIDDIAMLRGQLSTGVLSTVQGQLSQEQKKNKLEDSLDCFLKNNPDMNCIDFGTIAAFSNLTGIPIPQGRLTSEDKEKVFNDSVYWLRNNNPRPSDPASIAAPTDLVGVSLPEGTPADQKQAVEDALTWLRNNSPTLEDVDGATLGSLAHLAGLTMPSGDLSPEQKKAAMEQTLYWLRTNTLSLDAVNDVTITNINDIPIPGQRPSPLDRKEKVAEKELSWIRNNDPHHPVDHPVDLFDTFTGIPPPNHPPEVKVMPSSPSKKDENLPEWIWNRNRPFASVGLEPIENPDVIDESAPWASQRDEESGCDGHGPTPMAIPEDLCSDPSSEESKPEPKGIVIPVWLMLVLAVFASLVGTAALSSPGATQVGVPPPVLYDPTAPIRGSWPVLPNLPVVPDLPCSQDSTCGFIMGAINPDLPAQTRPLVNIDGSCQHWAREWLRTGKDTREFKADRIRQRFAMAVLYCEFYGDNWLEGELWISDLHECDWYNLVGVDPCGRRGQYQIIRSYGQQMRGTLPPEISMISTLWEVTLSDNLIEGTIPTEYHKLSQLDTFSLAFNLFHGPIPDFLWEFEDMAYMDLSTNFFTGTIPDTVPLTEPNLRVLFLDNNELSGTIPTTFGQLGWKRLHLDGNKLTGTVPSDINAPRIEEIMLHNNKLTGTFPVASFATEFAGKQSNLGVVTLQNNDLTGDMNDMCSLIDNGRLQTFQVDLDKMTCDCCTSGVEGSH